jgi:hypothetical protein
MGTGTGPITGRRKSSVGSYQSVRERAPALDWKPPLTWSGQRDFGEEAEQKPGLGPAFSVPSAPVIQVREAVEGGEACPLRGSTNRRGEGRGSPEGLGSRPRPSVQRRSAQE